jgi:hypothetical protein
VVDLTSTLRKQNTEAIQIIRESGLVVTPRPPEKDLEDFYHIHRVVAQNLTDTLYPKALLERVYGILGSLR